MGKLDKASTAADDSERAKKVCFQSCLFCFLSFLFCFYDSERAKKVLLSNMCRVVIGDKHQVMR